MVREKKIDLYPAGKSQKRRTALGQKSAASKQRMAEKEKTSINTGGN